MRVHRKMTGAVGAIALTAGALATAAATTAQAAPSPTAALVINEVYGGGGNSGATFDRDFIELTNVGQAALELTGWSVQYNSTTGTNPWQKTDLSGYLPAGATMVVAQAFGTNRDLPDVPFDLEGTIGMSGTGGKVALVNTTVALSGCASTCSSLPQVVDLVGWGTANDSATAPAPATTNATSVTRNATHANTANNAADFSLSNPPTPTACGDACTPPPPPPVEATIAEIQGSGAASPMVGDKVTTRGVVTAAYPTGGFFGFYLQTEGTGGARDLSAPSDGVFVYQVADGVDADATIGNFVEVTGTVDEEFGLTRIEASGADISDAGSEFDPAAAVTNPWPTTDAARESIEGMLYRPSGAYTVTNTFATNQFGEVGLAVGTSPLVQGTEVAAPGAPAKAVEADNLTKLVTLDDGASSNFLASSFRAVDCGDRPIPCLLNADQTPPYVSTTAPVRVGAAATFTDDVIVDYRFNLWRFQPTSTVLGPLNANSPAQFANTRTPAPDESKIGAAALKVASFNVLNYFTTLGAQTSGCQAYYDGDDNGTNVRTGCDLRGAWDSEDFGRQQTKTVTAINALDADVVGLMEVENSARLGEARDEALATLTAALNAQAGAGTWAYVPSSAELPAVELQDFITNAIIYKPANVMRVGEARALGTASQDGQAFVNAREPIAQVFKAKNSKADKFLFAVNHFKSKGSAGPFPGDKDSGDGQGASVTSRVLQAQALRDWIPAVTAETSTSAVILAGDFNSYAMEDPLDVLYDAGYANVEQHFEGGEYSYSFSGRSGSLDHMLLNDAALGLATGTDIWNINSGESVALEYSRYNYHGTLFHQDGPYRSADHDPVVLGLRATVK